MSQGVRICIFSGHTGGHLFPALAFAERYKRKFPQAQLYLMTSPKAKNLIEPLAEDGFDAVDYLNEFPLPAGRLGGGPRQWAGITLRRLGFLLKFSRSFIASFHYLNEKKPDLCVGFGSYVSFPAMQWAVWKKIPTLIHEQNIIAGKATKMLAAKVDAVAWSFEKTQCLKPPKRERVTGLPVRRKLFEASQGFRRVFRPVTAANPLHLLVTGGSQGAEKLNQIILRSFFQLLPEERKKIAVIHITGKNNFEAVTQEYEALKMKFKTYSFYGNMQELYSQSDFAITRAGANTLFEMALFGLPAIAVPFPYAAEGHQEANARAFEACGGLLLQKEEALTPEWLSGKLKDVFSVNIRESLSRNIASMAPDDAAEKMVDLASEFLFKEKTCPLSTAI